MHRSKVAKGLGGIAFVFVLGVLTWGLLGAADAPDSGAVYLTALGLPVVNTKILTTGTEVNVYVVVNSDDGILEGLTEENFRVHGLAGGDVKISMVQSMAPGAYLLRIKRADDGTWRWYEVIMEVVMRSPQGNAATLVRIDIP